MQQWVSDGVELCAPTLWLYEITSALCKVVRFGQITPAEAKRALELAQQLGVRLIAPDGTQARRAFEWTMHLNRAAAHDSFYLALAETLDCDLWTADRHLCNAVELPWVHCSTIE